MEIYKLSSDKLKPVDIVTDMESYHWVDRFASAGEFTIETPAIDKIMSLIPPSTYLGNSEDKGTMLVEKHSIRTDENGIPKLTISGRTGEAFLEGRYAVGSLSKGTEQDALSYDKKRVYDLMRDVLIKSSSYTWNGIRIDFPYLYIAPSTAVGPIIDKYEVPRRTVYQNLRELSEAYGVSFQMLRNTNDETPVTMRFRPGYIRTNKASPMFSYHFGDILDEQFVWDITNSTHLVHAYTPIRVGNWGNTSYRGHYVHRMKMVDRPESEPKDMMKYEDMGLEGLDDLLQKEVTNWSGDVIGHVSVPGAIKSVMDGFNKIEIQKYQERVSQEQAKLYFEAAKKTKQYSFTINPTNSRVYGSDYGLGDIITVQPSFGDSVDMRVSAFVRSMNESGYKEYPELVEYNPLADRMELNP